MKTVEYIGPEQELVGKTALVQAEDSVFFWVQFDDMNLVWHEQNLGFGKRPFLREHFKVLPEVDFDAPE